MRINSKKAKQHKKSSCKSHMCTSKILEFAAFWNEVKHKAVKLHTDIFLFSQEGWAETMWTVKRDTRLHTLSNQRAQTKGQEKSTVYQQICRILFSLLYSQFTTHPHCDPLRGKEKAKGVGLSWRRYFQQVQWESLDLHSNLMFDLFVFLLPVFF